MKLLEFDNYMFDLYGTLIDIRTDEHNLNTWDRWCKWLDAHEIKHASATEMHDIFFEHDKNNRKLALEEGGFDCPEIDVTPIYKEMLVSYGNAAARFTQEFLGEIGYAFRTASREYMRLFPGVDEFLKEIRAQGKHAYILSNAQKCYTWPEICFFDLQKKVDDVLISSDYRCMKPDLAFYNAMINKHKLNRATTVMIGDSRENDYEGALNAGLKAIWLGPKEPAGEFYLKFQA